MWVDLKALKAEIIKLEMEAEEKFNNEQEDDDLQSIILGGMVGLAKVEKLLNRAERAHREQGLEYIRSLREEGNEE